jgi:hypothetical protein
VTRGDRGFGRRQMVGEGPPRRLGAVAIVHRRGQREDGGKMRERERRRGPMVLTYGGARPSQLDGASGVAGARAVDAVLRPRMGSRARRMHGR